VSGEGRTTVSGLVARMIFEFTGGPLYAEPEKVEEVDAITGADVELTGANVD
jgi:hypothetical protein